MRFFFAVLKVGANANAAATAEIALSAVTRERVACSDCVSHSKAKAREENRVQDGRGRLEEILLFLFLYAWVSPVLCR